MNGVDPPVGTFATKKSVPPTSTVFTTVVPAPDSVKFESAALSELAAPLPLHFHRFTPVAALVVKKTFEPEAVKFAKPVAPPTVVPSTASRPPLATLRRLTPRLKTRSLPNSTRLSAPVTTSRPATAAGVALAEVTTCSLRAASTPVPVAVKYTFVPTNVASAGLLFPFTAVFASMTVKEMPSVLRYSSTPRVPPLSKADR